MMKWKQCVMGLGLTVLIVGCGGGKQEVVVLTPTPLVVVEPTIEIVPTEAADTIEIPAGRPILSPGEEASGFLAEGGEDEYLVVGLANHSIAAIIESSTGLDLAVELYHDKSGTILVREDSDERTEYLLFTPNFDGGYAIHVKPVTGVGGYTIRLLDNRAVLVNETTELMGAVRYSIDLKKGMELTAAVETEPNMDIGLKLYDESGTLVQEVDRFFDYELLYQEIEVDGTYEVVVELLSGQAGLYRIVIGSNIEQ